MSGATGEESLAILQRWEDSGGEVMGHLRSDDPTVLAHVLRAEQP